MNQFQNQSALSVVLSEEDLAALVRPQDERRATQRHAFQVTQRIAPIVGDEFPRREMFRSVVCKDISRGGIAFFLSAAPYFDRLELELSSPTRVLHVQAQVIGSNPIVGLEPYYLVRCQFTGIAGR